MSDELQPGDHLGGYRLEIRLGGGGFGSVWKATESATGRLVALKVLRTDSYSSDTLRLRSEVELLAATASSRSPHVVKVLGGGIEPQPYVVMEFIDGVDLGRELERRKRIPQLEVIRIGAAVADALSALESVGIIHRDIKPANVMIDIDGVIKLTDFGIAKIVGYDTITATSQMPMSMAYAAPEVWEGTATHRSDLYSLGILLFQCLAGRPPFTGSYAQVYRQHATKDPDWTLLPEGTVPALRDLLRECLAKAEEDRPTNAAEVAGWLTAAERELNARMQQQPSPDLPVHEPQAFGPWLRRERHPSQEWAFLCIHETSGEKATVEIHFSDDIEYGARLRKAVEVNPKLVPLGAERLLGTNRLVLRPGEAWVSPPPGQFQFWVAREELPVRPTPGAVSDEMLHTAAVGLARVREAAVTEGIDLTLPPESLHLMPDGKVLVRRPGLATTGDDGMAWLQGLRLDGPARTSIVNARGVREMAAEYTARAGVAREASESPNGAAGHTEFVTTVSTGVAERLAPPVPPRMPEVEAEASPVPKGTVAASTVASERPPLVETSEGAQTESGASDSPEPIHGGSEAPRLLLLLLLSALWMPVAFVVIQLTDAPIVGVGTGAIWGVPWTATLGSWIRSRGVRCSPLRAAAVGLGAGLTSFLLPYLLIVATDASPYGGLWGFYLFTVVTSGGLAFAVPAHRRLRWTLLVVPTTALAFWVGILAFIFVKRLVVESHLEDFSYTVPSVRFYSLPRALFFASLPLFFAGLAMFSLIFGAMAFVLRQPDVDDDPRGSSSRERRAPRTSFGATAGIAALPLMGIAVVALVIWHLGDSDPVNMTPMRVINLVPGTAATMTYGSARHPNWFEDNDHELAAAAVQQLGLSPAAEFESPGSVFQFVSGKDEFGNSYAIVELLGGEAISAYARRAGCAEHAALNGFASFECPSGQFRLLALHGADTAVFFESELAVPPATRASGWPEQRSVGWLMHELYGDGSFDFLGIYRSSETCELFQFSGCVAVGTAEDALERRFVVEFSQRSLAEAANEEYGFLIQDFLLHYRNPMRFRAEGNFAIWTQDTSGGEIPAPTRVVAAVIDTSTPSATPTIEATAIAPSSTPRPPIPSPASVVPTPTPAALPLPPTPTQVQPAALPRVGRQTVIDSYQAAFCKDPTTDEIDYWQARSETEPIAMAELLKYHQGYLALGGFLDETVTRSYHTVLHRDPKVVPGDDELAYWRSRILAEQLSCSDLLRFHSAYKAAGGT